MLPACTRLIIALRSVVEVISIGSSTSSAHVARSFGTNIHIDVPRWLACTRPYELNARLLRLNRSLCLCIFALNSFTVIAGFSLWATQDKHSHSVVRPSHAHTLSGMRNRVTGPPQSLQTTAETVMLLFNQYPS